MTVIYLVVMFAIIALAPALFLPHDTTLPADPLNTPAHIRPEWYFLAPYQLLKLVPNKFLGIALQLILVVVFVLWPFLDKSRQANILQTAPDAGPLPGYPGGLDRTFLLGSLLMKTLLAAACFVSLLAFPGAAWTEASQTGFPGPTSNEKPRIERIVCLQCHGTTLVPAAMRGIPKAWRQSIHYRNNVACNDCHGGDPHNMRPGHVTEAGFRRGPQTQRGAAVLWQVPPGHHEKLPGK